MYLPIKSDVSFPYRSGARAVNYALGKLVKIMAPEVSNSDVLAENARLKKRVEDLESSIVASEITTPRDWKLTRVEQTIFCSLLNNGVLTKQTIIRILYGDEITASAVKNMDVFIARIRRKTREAGVKIETILGVGYRLIDREAWTKALKARLVGQN